MAAWPNVAAWLVSTLPTLPGYADVAVFDGPPVTNDNPEQYVTVGFVAGDKAGTYQVTQHENSFWWIETGEVRCEMVCQSGDTDEGAVTANRQAVFALASALDQKIRTDLTLGGTLKPPATVEAVVEVESIQDANGNASALVMNVRYSTLNS